MRYFMGILIFAVLFYPASILGQPTLSFREGLNLATLSGEIMDRHPVNARATLKLGVSGTFPVRGRFGFQLNGDYVQKGAQDFLYDSIEQRKSAVGKTAVCGLNTDSVSPMFGT